MQSLHDDATQSADEHKVNFLLRDDTRPAEVKRESTRTNYKEDRTRGEWEKERKKKKKERKKLRKSEKSEKKKKRKEK